MLSTHTEQPGKSQRQKKFFEIIFLSDTPAGKAFDIILLILISTSVLAVILETVPALGTRYLFFFTVLEWVITILFTIEYVVRLSVVAKPLKWSKSFYGVIDLLAILPTYLSLFFVGAQYLITIRALRLLRIFRILKLTRFIVESTVLEAALIASRKKIFIFLMAVIMIVIFIGSLFYLIEGNINPELTSIPMSMYWAIVTLTTVGYGDIVPVTSAGKLLSNLLMITGYAIIAVPTGIVSVELAQAQALLEEDNRRALERNLSTWVCPRCRMKGHAFDANYCRRCGESLSDKKS